MKFDAILFDLDGTLLYTLADLATSANNALTELGLPTHPIEDYRHFIGNGMDGLVKRIVPPQYANDKPILKKCLALAKHEYSIHYADSSIPYDGIVELLTELDNLGITKTIFSNKPDKYTQIMVKQILADFSFDIVFGVRDDVPKKPDPSAALRIANELNIPPDRFIYLGDSDTDMQTATTAGMFAAGALWGYRDAAELQSHGAKALLSSPTDLLKLLK